MYIPANTASSRPISKLLNTYLIKLRDTVTKATGTLFKYILLVNAACSWFDWQKSIFCVFECCCYFPVHNVIH